MNNSKMCGQSVKHIDLAGRMLLALVFLMSSLGTFSNPTGTVAFMQSFGIPFAGLLVWVVTIFLLLASVLLVVDWKRCLVAAALILYTVSVTIIFHTDFSDQVQLTFFLKNLGIIGGLLMIMSGCKSCCSVDEKESK